MKERVLGRTGIKVSEVGFGAWAIGGNAHGNSYGPTEDATSLAAVRRAVDLGCTFFDTADVYGWGHSEEILGQALEGRREDVVIATKVGGDFYHGGVRMNFEPGYIAFALERSLRRLRTDHVDLYQLHNPPAESMADPATYEALDRLKEENKIRAYGVSIHEPFEGTLCIESGRPDVLQIPFSILRSEWAAEFLPDARQANVGIIAREPLGNGFLAGGIRMESRFVPGDIRSLWPRSMIEARVRLADRLRFLEGPERTLAQAALRFVLASPEVSVTIPGAKSPVQVEENLRASEAPTLTPSELQGIRHIVSGGPGS
ncbi:MAG: hypothetical protein A3K68_01425 [Euryarchaeota archaeon RBG_16_68_13]|nr:MAG: hypothetical protein A3K68_01425 [Euryarchaeota archaeon RBG_16_68_13]